MHTFRIAYCRKIEPTTHTQSSIVRMDHDPDEDDNSSSSSEVEDSVLNKTEMLPLSNESNASVCIIETVIVIFPNL